MHFLVTHMTVLIQNMMKLMKVKIQLMHFISSAFRNIQPAFVCVSLPCSFVATVIVGNYMIGALD